MTSPSENPAIDPLLSTERGRLPGEIIFAFLGLVLSLVLGYQAWTISGFSGLSTAGIFPMLATGTMVISALFVVMGTVRNNPEYQGNWLAMFFADVLAPRIIVFAVLMTAYLFALQPLGFVISSFLFLFAGMAFLYRRRYLMLLALSAAAIAVVYLLFRYVFVVILPRGIFL